MRFRELLTARLVTNTLRLDVKDVPVRDVGSCTRGYGKYSAYCYRNMASSHRNLRVGSIYPLALRCAVVTLAIVVSVEDTRQARNAKTVHLDTAGVAHEKYVRGEPTPVKPT